MPKPKRKLGSEIKKRILRKAADAVERVILSRKMVFSAGKTKYNVYYHDLKNGTICLTRLSRAFFSSNSNGSISRTSNLIKDVESRAREMGFKKISVEAIPKIGRVLEKHGYFDQGTTFPVADKRLYLKEL